MDNKKIVILILNLTAICYLFTLTPSLGSGDSGELTSVAYTLGVAHPPGYPLFTMLGRIFSFMPIGSIAMRVNLLSLVAAVAGIGFLFLMLGFDPITGLIGSLFYAFSFTFWAEGSGAEVYTLEILLLVCCLWAINKWRNGGNQRYLILFGYLLGLGISHRLTFLLFLPAFFYLIFKDRKRITVRLIAQGAAFLIIGLSILIYILIRARANPPLNWGNPDDIPRFLNHITGFQYRNYLFTLPLSNVMQRVIKIFSLFSREFTIAALIAIPGLYYGFQRKKDFSVALILILLFNLFYATNYGIPDYDTYLLPTFLVVSVFIGFGISFLAHQIRGKVRFILFLLPIIPFIKNITINMEHRQSYVYDCAENILKSLPGDAIFTTSSTDFANGVIYLQVAEGRKADITIVLYDMLGSKAYYDMIKKKINLPEQPLKPIIGNIIRLNVGNRPIYVGVDLMKEAFIFLERGPNQYLIIPEGLVNRISKEKSINHLTITAKNDSLWQDYRIRGITKVHYPKTRFGQIQLIYGVALNNLGAFYLNQGWPDDARKEFLKALNFPNRPSVRSAIMRNLNMINSKRSNRR